LFFGLDIGFLDFFLTIARRDFLHSLAVFFA
jgi:hypothetical protein